jgi:hypothetical protein
MLPSYLGVAMETCKDPSLYNKLLACGDIPRMKGLISLGKRFTSVTLTDMNIPLYSSKNSSYQNGTLMGRPVTLL